MNNNESLAHAKRDRAHHIVRMPKYSKKVLYGQVREGVGSVFRQLVAVEGGIAIQEGGVCVGHIHMCLRIAPKHSVAKVMGCLKGKSALIVFDHHPEWRKATGKGGTLWTGTTTSARWG